MKSSFTIGVFLACILSALTGRSQVCGTDFPINRLLKAQSQKQIVETRLEDKTLRPFVVAMTVHIVRRSDGTGGISRSAVIDAVKQLNWQFAPIKLSFYIQEIREIRDDLVYDYEQTNSEEAFIRNGVDRTINIYVTNSLSINGKPYGGYAYYPGGPDLIVLTHHHMTNGSTLAHEMGHFYDLDHTHGPVNDRLTSELADGSNCANAGDRFCDTPADPQLDSLLVNANCEYVGDVLDVRGNPFEPDPTNIMSYSRADCRNQFTLDQYAHMRDAFEEQRLNIIAHQFVAFFTASKIDIQAGEEVTFANWSINGVAYSWSFGGGTPAVSTLFEPTVKFEKPGAYNVVLAVDFPNDQRVVHQLEKYIIVSEEQVLDVTQSPHISQNAESISLYPNPASNYLSLDIPNHLRTNAFEISDLSGKSVLAGSVQTSIDVSQLRSGVYLFRLIMEDEVFTQRFIKR